MRLVGAYLLVFICYFIELWNVPEARQRGLVLQFLDSFSSLSLELIP